MLEEKQLLVIDELSNTLKTIDSNIFLSIVRNGYTPYLSIDKLGETIINIPLKKPHKDCVSFLKFMYHTIQRSNYKTRYSNQFIEVLNEHLKIYNRKNKWNKL